MDTVAPFIAAITGCATAPPPASKPLRPPVGLAAPATPSDRLAAGDAQTSSKSLPLLPGFGFEDGDWSILGGEPAASASASSAGAPVSWRQYSPRNQYAERFTLELFVFEDGTDKKQTGETRGLWHNAMASGGGCHAGWAF